MLSEKCRSVVMWRCCLALDGNVNIVTKNVQMQFGKTSLQQIHSFKYVASFSVMFFTDDTSSVTVLFCVFFAQERCF